MVVIEQIIGQMGRDPLDKPVIPVPYEWFECERRRIKKVAADGTELGVAVPGGVKAGDILYESERGYYVVQLTKAHLISVAIHSTEEAARVGFELGNRHLSLKILPDQILVPYDAPTFLYLHQLGFEVREEEGTFHDFIRCKAHGGRPEGETSHPHQGHPHTHVGPDGRTYTHTHG